MESQLHNNLSQDRSIPLTFSEVESVTQSNSAPVDSFVGDLSAQSLGDNIFNSISDAILVLDADARIERINPATLELTGFSEAELVGRSVEILTRNRRFFEKMFERSLHKSALGNRFEMHCQRKDGSRFPVSVSTSTIFDSATDSHKLICVARDITKGKRLEAESRAISRIIHGAASTANLEELFELIHRTIKKIVYAENFFVALFDPETEMLTMQFWVDKYDPMPAPLKVGRSLSAYVFRKGRSMLFTDADAKRLIERGEVESVGTDSPIWLGVPLKTPSGNIGVLVVQDYENSDTYTYRDVELLTSVADQIALAIERKRAEDALIRSQERFELVARATSDAVWDWNLSTNEIWWNEGFQKLFGYESEAIGGGLDSWIGRLHPDDSERVVHDIHRHIESGHTNWSDEYRFRRADGSYAFVIDRGYVVYDNETPLRMLGSMMDVTDRKSLEDQLTHQALHDPLTKIANRVLFKDRVDHALTKLARANTSLAVLFLDLDNFKAINDSLGHAAGDKLLVCVAERLQDCLREADTAARLGGDEFAVLVETMYRPDEAVMIAERILSVFRQPFVVDGKEIHVGTSIGIAVSSPAALSSEELLRNADLAMYLAKSQGKGKHIVFEAKMHEALMERIELEEELRRGIEKREFVLHYQPILDLQSNKMLGMEALVRWMHPRLGLLAPMKFIPMAEETNLIVPLGEWILGEACRQVQAWRVQYPEDLDVAVTVNISIRQFLQAELVELVSRALRNSGLPPRSLILEITESFMMQDTEATIAKLHELKKLGVRLAIDDFGTGYSSLSYLQRFPIDILKIDKSFIDKLGQGREGNAVARAIIMMGDSLNLKTIAEGIEHPEQISELQLLGCEAGQGFHFSKALTVGDMDEFLLDRRPTVSA
ncbi:MAG: EAL domain-containing protein [Pyrinomonadaceae bacterium]|nr:EAL domain-containing protein [Pyrinomonadaceae bacterium]